jgi:hypothetical protein
VRKISGFNKPSKANEAAFLAAVDGVAAVSARLLDSLETTALHETVPARRPRHRRALPFATSAYRAVDARCWTQLQSRDGAAPLQRRIDCARSARSCATIALRAKRALDEEMRSYPTPIPRCDAQFNHAYEQRSRLTALLQQIDAVGDEQTMRTVLLGAMTEFASLPPTGETAEERGLRERIGDALARVRGIPS